MSGSVVVALIGIPSTLLATLASIIAADRIAERRHSIPCSLCSLPTGHPYPSDGEYRPVHCDACKTQIKYRLAVISEEPTA